MSRWFLKAQYGTGGGSGGHTIVDDGGDTLEQRSKLQFKGTYSEDNMTGNTTEINITRTMTRSEFELLSNDEKKGLINVIDETSGVDGKFQPVIYSEEEREIGVWTDGKPLYEKTIAKSQSLSFSSQTVVEDLTSLNIDTFVGFSSSRFEADGNIVIGDGLTYMLYDETTKILRATQKYSDRVITGLLIVKFYYTKTTDAPGSGKWTPQGVPAHHYSTDEHIVGTWIDGSTLYEKTLKIEPVALSNGSTIAHGISNLNIVVSSDMVMHRNNGEFVLPYTSQYNKTSNFIITSTDLSFVSSDTWGSSDYINLYVTLRYTKSST